MSFNHHLLCNICNYYRYHNNYAIFKADIGKEEMHNMIINLDFFMIVHLIKQNSKR